jgi:hypothetical protein
MRPQIDQEIEFKNFSYWLSILSIPRLTLKIVVMLVSHW